MHFDDVRLVDIGQRAGVSKASVYRYFESKEAIFLELLAREIEAWVREAEGALASVAGAGTVDAVARIVATFVTYQNGLVPAAHPPPAVQAVLAEPEFAPFRADYRRALRGTARRLLTALVREDAPAQDAS